MHNNYYFFRLLSKQLEKQLNGWIVATCFSQNKDELIIGLTDPHPPHHEFYIKALLESQFSCLHFPENFHRSKRNSVDLFSQILDTQVVEVRQTPNDRSFSLMLQSVEEPNQTYQLVFKMHGNRANVILLQGKEVLSIFKHQLIKDEHLDPEVLPLKIEHSFANFEVKEGKANKLYPTLGPLPVKYLEQQAYEDASLEEKWRMLESMLHLLKNPEAIYTTFINGSFHLSLLAVGEIEQSFQEPIQAINHFFLKYIRDFHLLQEKNTLLKKLGKQITQTENYIQKNDTKLNELEEGAQYSQIADIIMANMHQIPPNSRKVVFNNFYTNQPIEIKLKQNVSPQKNAEALYRKAKNQKIELEKLKANIALKEDRLLHLYEHLEKLEKLEHVRDIRQYAKDHNLEEELNEREEVLPYRSFEIRGYQVWVGKNAKNNDTLLRNYSWKEDLWLHAKDVPGSHVLIKHQAGKNFPKDVVEQAASLAAYYSKRKTDSLCPVIVTPRKFVRKSKDMQAGQVIVSQEEVIMVEPKMPG
ncbi:NFACT RNA binding domain-containing protein [Porifericola rhodea]|uniref:NFACT RNA binding domain-containing protein n=1 Tax=Porifericola rhodea TaxID=930972 RepID=UPI00266549C5|nr:NFACT RNA binding domain-containing protein [Porifericola rhodea]WKN31297.1 NFACT RNA binding domain-containing protein [Porifericola rhodea]